MTDRTALAQAFLAQTEWADATSSLLAGDASNRKYHRLCPSSPTPRPTPTASLTEFCFTKN